MQLPADLSEGFYWVRDRIGGTEVVSIWRDEKRGWLAETSEFCGIRLSNVSERWTAMERVAPPSWEAGRE